MPLLSEERRKKLREKAQKRASKQLSKATGQANRQISRIESGADRRSAGVRRSYSRGVENIGNISTHGLTGSYAKQAEREIAASQAGLERVMPHHVNKVQARAAGRVRDIRSGLREAKQSAVESNLSALTTAARERVAAKQEAVAGRHQETRAAQKEFAYQIQNAPDEVMDRLHLQRVRDQLAKTIAGQDNGVDIMTARRVVEQAYRKMLEKNMLPPGVLSTDERVAAARPVAGRAGSREGMEGDVTLSPEALEYYQKIMAALRGFGGP